MAWRARSASDRSDDWPFWYITDDQPADRNKLLDAIEALTGHRPIAMPFVPRAMAEQLASAMNAAPEMQKPPR